MNKVICAILFFACSWVSVFAQSDTIHISGVEVQAGHASRVWLGVSRVVEVITRKEIESMPVNSLNDLLKYALNADIRKRGTGDVQADISIRGSSFEQVLVLLNGVSMNDPQTGHHKLDIPVDLSDIERIEILQGSGSRIFGPNAFAGVINIITGHSAGPSIHTNLSYGSFETLQGTIASSFSIGKSNHYISLSGNSSDGFISNTDYATAKAYYRGNYAVREGKLGISAGWMNKEFGAQGFYSPKYPDQFEATRTELGSIDFSYGKRFKIEPKVSWRRHHDRFELFRNEAPSWYRNHNYHMSDVIDAGLNLSFQSRAGISNIGFQYTYEHIFSNVLGDLLDDTLSVPQEPKGFFIRGDARKNVNIFIGHDLSIRRFSASLGVLLYWSDAFGYSYYPGIDMSLQVGVNARIYASVNKSLRLPSFTELYYKGPVNIGNSELRPEEAWSCETGLKYSTTIIKAHASVFYRYNFNLIDWIQTRGENLWHTENLTSINTWGVETSFDIDLDKICDENCLVERVHISYSYLDMSKYSGDFISYYVLDYLRHSLGITANIRIVKDLSVVLGGRYYSREGSYISFPSGREAAWKPVFLADAGLKWNLNPLELKVDANNLFNTSYFDYGNIAMPGFNINVGLICKIGLKN